MIRLLLGLSKVFAVLVLGSLAWWDAISTDSASSICFQALLVSQMLPLPLLLRLPLQLPLPLLLLWPLLWPFLYDNDSSCCPLLQLKCSSCCSSCVCGSSSCNSCNWCFLAVPHAHCCHSCCPFWNQCSTCFPSRHCCLYGLSCNWRSSGTLFNPADPFAIVPPVVPPVASPAHVAPFYASPACNRCPSHFI